MPFFSQLCRHSYLKGNIQVSHMEESLKEAKCFWYIMSRGQEKDLSPTCHGVQEEKGYDFSSQPSSKLNGGPDPCAPSPPLSSEGEPVSARRHGGWKGKPPKAVVKANNSSPVFFTVFLRG